GLVRLGPDDTLVGDLADRWEVDATGGGWTFHLRPGPTWQGGEPLAPGAGGGGGGGGGGEPLTADDVVFTIAALSDPTYLGPGATSWREVTAAAIDPQTVTLTLASPLGGLLQAATQPTAPAHLLSGDAPA